MKFEDLWNWNYMKEDSEWYYEVTTNRKPAKYLIEKRVEAEFDEIKDSNGIMLETLE